METKTAAGIVTAVVVIAAICAVLIVMEPADEDGDGFTVIQTGDTHGLLEEDLGFDNAAALAAMPRGPAFLFDTGNFLQGPGTALMTRGDSSVQIMNAAGYDAACPGIYDFSYGMEDFRNDIKALDFPAVCANIEFTDGGEDVLEDFVVIEKDGVKVGVFGIIDPDSASMLKSDASSAVRITDPVEAAEKAISELKDRGAGFIVALGSFGVDSDGNLNAVRICKAADGIDLFLDGMHRVSSGYTEKAGDTLISVVGENFSQIGKICKNDGITAYQVSYSDASDSRTADVIDEQLERTENYRSNVIGHSEIKLEGGNRIGYDREFDMGDFTADALRHATGADIAFVNAGSVRGAIEAGDVTAGMVCDIFPFMNYVVTKEADGKTVLEALELSLSKYPAKFGGFLQLSGMTVTWDPTAEPMHRVVSATVGDSPIDPEEKYTVTGSDFTMSGGDGYDMLADLPVLKTFRMMHETVIDYVDYLDVIRTLETDRLTTV